MLVESGNPVHSLADSTRMREAMAALDFVVVIDVALTETAREADYVLPASSQFEKWECTFFNLEFPANFFQLRRPVFDPMPGTRPEADIHADLCRSLGAYTDDDLVPLRAAAAVGRVAYLDAFFTFSVERPELSRLAPVILYETLGPTLATSDGASAAGAAAVWGLAHLCAGSYPEAVMRAGIDGDSLGDALFDHILANPSGVTFTLDDYPETFARLRTDDGRIRLAIDVLLRELDGLADEPAPLAADTDYPLVLSAGERRSSTANTIYRDPAWRKKDLQGALRMSSADASGLGLTDGDRARITTRAGSAVTVVEVTDTLLPGHVSLPNGFGLGHDGSDDAVGVAPNELTSTGDRDWFAGTPHHKHVRAASSGRAGGELICAAPASMTTTARSPAPPTFSPTGGRRWSCGKPSPAPVASPTSRPTSTSRRPCCSRA